MTFLIINDLIKPVVTVSYKLIWIRMKKGVPAKGQAKKKIERPGLTEDEI